MRIQILTPDEVFKDISADELILPIGYGQIGVLQNHVNLLTAIDIGARAFRQGPNWIAVALIGGFALIKNNKVTILVNRAVNADEVNKQEAAKNLDDVTSRFETTRNKSEKLELSLAVKRARARYQLCTWAYRLGLKKVT